VCSAAAGFEFLNQRCLPGVGFPLDGVHPGHLDTDRRKVLFELRQGRVLCLLQHFQPVVVRGAGLGLACFLLPLLLDMPGVFIAGSLRAVGEDTENSGRERDEQRHQPAGPER
jgi:hypothetical protein